jgi:predicted ATP-grasp superfamily ATP-dependent carboligase
MNIDFTENDVMASSRLNAPQSICETYDALVLDAALRQSLATVRSLGRQGMRVAVAEVAHVLEESPYVPAFSSRWCRHAHIMPAFKHDTDQFAADLKSFLLSTDTRVLMTASDGTLAVIREHREELERLTHVALAQEEALAIAIDKERTLAIASGLDIAVPRGVPLRATDGVTEAIREVGLPAVVKPVESWQAGLGVRLICQLVTTHEEARRVVEELTQWGGSVLFQQFLPGRREAINFLYANGEMYARFAQWAKRTQPPLGGTSVYRQSIALPPDSGEQAECLVREIALEGYSEVEFRRDAYGKPYLMEINPRLSASIEVAIRAGVDFPYLLYKWACGERLQRVERYHTGRWMRFLEGDLRATVQAIKQRGRPGIPPPLQAIAEFATAFCVPASYDYVDWSDPRPLWTAALDYYHRTFRSHES